MKVLPLLIADELAVGRRRRLPWIAFDPFLLHEVVELLVPVRSTLNVAHRASGRRAHQIMPDKACLMILRKSSFKAYELNLA